MARKKYEAVFLVGRPGCGKGTQARLLQKYYGFSLVKTGTLFRALAKKQTPLGRNIKNVLEQGKLMPPLLANFVVLSALARIPLRQPVIFDGSPRTRDEAQWLLEALPWFGRTKSIALHLAISPKESLARLALRGRTDDRRRVIKERLREFERKVVPALAFLRKRRMLKTINGEQSIQKTAQDIRKTVAPRRKS